MSGSEGYGVIPRTLSAASLQKQLCRGDTTCSHQVPQPALRNTLPVWSFTDNSKHSVGPSLLIVTFGNTLSDTIFKSS